MLGLKGIWDASKVKLQFECDPQTDAPEMIPKATMAGGRAGGRCSGLDDQLMMLQLFEGPRTVRPLSSVFLPLGPLCSSLVLPFGHERRQAAIHIYIYIPYQLPVSVKILKLPGSVKNIQKCMCP